MIYAQVDEEGDNATNCRIDAKDLSLAQMTYSLTNLVELA